MTQQYYDLLTVIKKTGVAAVEATIVRNAQKASLISINPNAIKTEVKQSTMDILDELKKKRKEIIGRSTTCDRNPQTFFFGEEELQRKFSQVADINLDTQQAIDQEYITFATSLISANRNSENFVMKSKKEVEELRKKPVYTKATVNFRLPNNSIFRGDFAQMETIADIHTFVKEFLADDEPFELITFPPRKVYSNLKKTIFEESLAPNTQMIISFKNDKYVRENYLSDLAMKYRRNWEE